MTDQSIIDRPEAIETVCASIRSGAVLAFDTEFVRERTYFPQWCLAQVATPDELFLIDVLDPEAAAQITAALIEAPGVTVLHSARQDLEVLARVDARPLTPLFDTQLAAALLGYPEQVGYGAIVKDLLGVELAKDATRTDWSQRPLSARQLAYAADDVRYLRELYPVVLEKLNEKGRTAWADEDCRRMIDSFDIDVVYDTTSAGERLKGLNRYPDRVQFAAAGLAEVRERFAQASDRPRRWVVDDALVLELASRIAEGKPVDRALSSLPAALREGFAAVEATVLATDDADVPQGRQGFVPDPAERKAVKKLNAVVAQVAADLAVEPAVLARRRDLERAVRGQRDGLPFTGWRADIVGVALAEALDAA